MALNRFSELVPPSPSPPPLHSNLQNGKTEMSDYHISATNNKKYQYSDINLFYRWFFCVRNFKGWPLSFSICFIESFCFSLSFSYWFSFSVVICFNREKRCDGFPKWTVEVDPNFRSNHCNSKNLVNKAPYKPLCNCGLFIFC